MSRPLKIVCDANMPFVREAFGTLGEVLALDGREIRRAHLRGADLLITRSTTRVDRELLADSRLRFYGSGVIGTDHIDAAWLKQAGIPWCGAPGCNAESVAQYVTAALLCLGGRHGCQLAGRTLGVVGAGHVGRRVCAKGRALGMRVIVCDPPRQRDPADTEARSFVTFERLLAEADVVTMHVPLTRCGTDPTWRMLDASRLALMRPGSMLINAARGPVLDGAAWLAALERGVPARTVLDTWDPEPAYPTELLARVDLGTPHIAGHSYEGKVNGTMQVYRAACATLGVPATYAPNMPPAPVPSLEVDAAGMRTEDLLRMLVNSTYDIVADDTVMRAGAVGDAAARAKAFDRQRREYPMRREFAATSVTLKHATETQRRMVEEIGFRMI
ncbi:MAG: 4-phosphoerythronate dehydrogenase [Kiritimatiellae bacterium]|nr:4-phosphoerythronate dehydrogenase [Kiritimatiellia bacterium]